MHSFIISYTVTIFRMLIIALVIGSFIVVSSAQSQPSSECITANATFYSNLTCLFAYIDVLTDNATDQEQMMICDEGQECNTLIENVITLCGDAVSYS